MTRSEFDRRQKQWIADEQWADCLQRGEIPYYFDPEPDDPPASESRESDYILGVKEVLEHVPVDRTTLWRMVNAGRFPAPFRIAQTRRNGWRWSTVLAWIKKQEARS